MNSTKIKNSSVAVISLVFVLVLHGAIPFLALPTLGQAIWTTGFSQSFANQTILAIHATNFGIPEPAAIAFGLAGAYPASLFIRLGLHPADAYTLMVALWLAIAFYGAFKIARSFKLSENISALTSVLWLSMPIVWNHASYSMVSIGIGLLPFYFWISLQIFQCFDSNFKSSISIAGIYLLTTIIAIFMDGYSFMMFAVGSSIFGAYTFLRFPEHRNLVLKFSFPIHIISFVLAYTLYASYIGKTQFDPSPLDFFRGWGVDLMFLAIPSKGVHWLWDTLGGSVVRTGRHQFGDASVWTTTFAFPIVVVGTFAWWRLRKESKIATGFLLVALFGFYMGMGPSLKINSLKPDGANGPLMNEKYAVMPTGNALLYEYLPGFKNMRAAYRWSALGILGFWLLIILLISREQTTRLKWLVGFSVIFLIVSNLPNVNKKLAKDIDYRHNFFDIEKLLIEDIKQVIHKGDVVAFLPYRNDFLVNYIASRSSLLSYNIGGDKNLLEARKHWPETMAEFRMGAIDEDFTPRVLLLLSRGEANAVLLPNINLLWAAHAWPARLEFKGELKPTIAELRNSGFVDIDEREYYSVVRLAKKYSASAHQGQLEHQIYQTYCMPPYCLQYLGKKPIQSQVGMHIGTGMQTNGQSGYLIYGPYQPMEAGEYVLQVTGKVDSYGDNAVVDVVWHKAGKTYARFKGLGTQKASSNHVLLEEKVTLDEDVDALEIRIRVDKKADLVIDGYSLMSITSVSNKDEQ